MTGRSPGDTEEGTVLGGIMPIAPLTISLQEAAYQLGVHPMSVYRHVRSGKLAATQVGMAWRVRGCDVDAFEKECQQAAGTSSPTIDATATVRALEAGMVAGDNTGTWWLVEGGLGDGLDPSGVLTTLLSPALRSIGDRWAAGELSVAEEHRATAVAQRIIGRLGIQFSRPSPSRGTVILAAPATDLHTLPVAMVADLLRWRRFDVVELGANTPSDALAHAVCSAHHLVAVGIASTTTGLDHEVTRSVRAVRATQTQTTIIVGGNAIRDEAHAHELGADRWTGCDGTTVIEAVETSLLDCPFRAVADAW